MSVTAAPNAIVHTHTFPNGLTLLVQPMPGVSSASFSLLFPAGSAWDPPGAGGSAGLITEWMTRGAGSRDSRELSDHLDGLGLHRGHGATREYVSFDGVLLGPELPAALEAYADIIRRPEFDPEEFLQAHELALQELDASEDQPTTKFSREIWRRVWPYPYSRPVEGVHAEVESVTPEAAAEDYRTRLAPQGAIMAIAGDVDVDRIRDLVFKLFGDWVGTPRATPTGPDQRSRLSMLVEPLEQLHVAVACRAIPFGTPDYNEMNIVIRVLSGGMGARLFTEVREKRSLCYSVSAGLNTLRGRAALVAKANPTPDKADETIAVMLAELRKLNREGITSDELARAKVGEKCRQVMNSESTRARSSIISFDWFHLGRVRSPEEVLGAVEKVTVGSVLEMLQRNPLHEFTLVSLGARQPVVPDLD